MTRKYSLVIEADATGYSAYVPEGPTILVTGRSLDELTARAAEAIRIYAAPHQSSGRYSANCRRRPQVPAGA